jgi:hypothetical protein
MHGTKITSGASRNPVIAGHPAVLSGKLIDKATHKVLPGRVIWWEGISGGRAVLRRLHTGRKGVWAITIKRGQLAKRLTWAVLYLGEQGHHPAGSPNRTLKIG